MTPAPSMLSLAQGYLNERRRLGFALATPGALLLSFARFADRTGHRGPLTVQLMMDWAQGEAKRATPATWARRLEILRPFARYRAQIEPGTEVPCADVFNHKRRRPTPHIYTVAEIADLLAAARRLPPAGTLRPLTYETLFGLIAATGLRLSEALRLQCGDFDVGGGTLDNQADQILQVPSRATALHDHRSSVPVPLGTPALHLSRAGRALVRIAVRDRACQENLHGVFAGLRAELGWTARGTLPMPRIHDLRHSFVCRRVMLWHETGTNIDNAMLALSTYVGHAKVSDTYWYLTAVPDLMAVAGKRFELFAAADAREARHG